MSRFLAAPIWRGDAHVGVLLIVENGPCEISEEVLGVSERLAQMVGLVLRNRQLRDLATERLRADTVLWELLDSRGETDATRALVHARRLGYRWIGPHVVLLANAADAALINDLHHKILDLDAHAPTDTVNGSLIAIVRDAWLSALSQDGVSTGVSSPCADVGRLPSAYREARNALETGVKLFGPGRMTRIEDLKSYQFVPTLLKNGFADGPEYQLLSRLSDDLLKTLEVYLDAGGNATRAAKQLFLHRNTLRQRLDRISGLLAVDLAASDRWLSLQLAVKAARLARLDNSEEERSLY